MWPKDTTNRHTRQLVCRRHKTILVRYDLLRQLSLAVCFLHGQAICRVRARHTWQSMTLCNVSFVGQPVERGLC
jgi:hypothetical protein